VLLLGLFFGFFAISLMSPIASNTILPFCPDFLAHIGLIVQAKMALVEGQFPLRIAPWQFGGWRYPVFQFYACLSHTVAALIYEYITPTNPFIALKITLWLALTFAGVYIYRLVYQLTSSPINSLLSAVVYMSAPYFIINLNVRGDFGESVALGIIPIILFYTFQMVRKPNLINFCCVAFSWSMLALTHTITFVYTSFFIGLFLVSMIFIKNSGFTFRKLLFLGLAYVYSCLLALWFLAPVAIVEKLLTIDAGLGGGGMDAWLTPIASLLSVTAISPIPLPGNGWLQIPLYPAVAWPMLLAVGTAIYVYINRGLIKKTYIDKFYGVLLLLFFLSFFMIWTPLNFWHYLPKYLTVVQFSYCLLAQLMWIGTILFAWAISWIFQDKLDKRHLMVGVLLLGIANGSWLHTNESSKKTIENIVQNPDMGYGRFAFLTSQINSTESSFAKIIQPVSEIQKFCKQVGVTTICNISVAQEGYIQLPILYYPNLLEITANRHMVSYQPFKVDVHSTLPLYVKDTIINQMTNPMLAGIKLLPGSYEISAKFVGLQWANWISIAAWFGLAVLFLFSVFKRSKDGV